MVQKSVERCTSCVLPTEYPGIEMNADGVCHHCREDQKVDYLGLRALKRDIDELLYRYPNREYDCVLGLSGGRDSTYLLHILKEELGLNVLTFFVDHGLIPEHTRDNVHKITTELGVPLIIDSHTTLTDCFPIQYKAWLKKPRVQTLSTLCMGCKSSIIRNFYRYAKEYNAPLLMLGWTPFEGARYKMNLMRSDPRDRSILSYVSGYVKEVLKNPSLVMHPKAVATQLQEFMTFYGPYKSIQNRLFKKIEFKPFHRHLRWEEKVVTETITERYGWQNFDGIVSSWRGDCLLGPIRQYLYHEILGYNDKAPHFSDLIRDGQLSREEALERLPREERTKESIVRDCCEALSIDFERMQRAIEEARASYRKEKPAHLEELLTAPL